MPSSINIENFLNFLHDCEQKHSMSETDELEANAETQDILHSLEFQEHSYQECAKLSRELKVIRQKRRKAKDTIYETKPVLEWIDQNRTTIKGLERLLGEVRKAEKATENRIYTPRTRRTNKS